MAEMKQDCITCKFVNEETIEGPCNVCVHSDGYPRWVAMPKPMEKPTAGVELEAVLEVYRGDICYESNADDQSFGMWVPVTCESEHGFQSGDKFVLLQSAQAAVAAAKSDYEAMNKELPHVIRERQALAVRNEKLEAVLAQALEALQAQPVMRHSTHWLRTETMLRNEAIATIEGMKNA